MSILEFLSIAIVFGILAMFIVFVVKNIRKNTKLKLYFKSLIKVGITLIALMFVSGVVSKDINIFISLMFIYYLKVLYFSTLISFLFFVVRNIYMSIRINKKNMKPKTI
ncbi:hypothetical protein ACFI18_004538 [Salmonella enterica]